MEERPLFVKHYQKFALEFLTRKSLNLQQFRLLKQPRILIFDLFYRIREEELINLLALSESSQFVVEAVPVFVHLLLFLFIFYFLALFVALVAQTSGTK